MSVWPARCWGWLLGSERGCDALLSSSRGDDKSSRNICEDTHGCNRACKRGYRLRWVCKHCWGWKVACFMELQLLNHSRRRELSIPPSPFLPLPVPPLAPCSLPSEAPGFPSDPAHAGVSGPRWPWWPRTPWCPRPGQGPGEVSGPGCALPALTNSRRHSWCSQPAPCSSSGPDTGLGCPWRQPGVGLAACPHTLHLHLPAPPAHPPSSSTSPGVGASPFLGRLLCGMGADSRAQRHWCHALSLLCLQQGGCSPIQELSPFPFSHGVLQLGLVAPGSSRAEVLPSSLSCTRFQTRGFNTPKNALPHGDCASMPPTQM